MIKKNRKSSDIEDKYRKMNILEVDIDGENMEAVLKRLKNKKADPDGLKNEMYKKLGEDRITLNALTECYINLFEGEKEPPGWKESITYYYDSQNNKTNSWPTETFIFSWCILQNIHVNNLRNARESCTGIQHE